MANKMLIDASHPEETRVVVLRGARVEEFDFESASKKQLRGNIYLAKVTRVEPSLQAAFVDYGGNRHGFLAFSEIHPDYYQIPVSDRQALIEEDARAQRDEDDDEAGQRRSRRFRRGDRGGRRAEKRSSGGDTVSEPEDRAPDGRDEAEFEAAPDHDEPRVAAAETSEQGDAEPGDDDPSGFAADQDLDRDSGSAQAGGESVEPLGAPPGFDADADAGKPQAAAFSAQDEAFSGAATVFPAIHAGPAADHADAADHASAAAADDASAAAADDASAAGSDDDRAAIADDAARESASSEAMERSDREPSEFAHEAGENSPLAQRHVADDDDVEDEEEDEQVEQLGGDAMEEVPTRPQRYRKQYKIQEVIKRRQVLLVQVVKEERGNKGAALTTYLSLAGRYSVLMPNTARGGGISRKITDSTDRQRLKSIAQELEVPEGMGVILRTAGASRTKPEVKRDFEYLLRMWETVRETTLKSTAPTLVYEEGSLIKRAIRDLFNKDIDDIVVAGDAGFREARDFMRLLMPSHAHAVQPYRDLQPIFAKSGVEAQLDAMFLNQVTLKSGGYIVINQTEALVAIDVNSGRSTREHNIEDTALRTNLEAADEITRQLRLRDLAGLIVIDFIDMEEGRNNRAVERRLKDALKNDRARIQIGRISHFGLLEMSRQRIRTGVLEGSTEICPNCSGSGMLRSTASIALHVLRTVEDALLKSVSHDLIVKTRTPVALYILNEKRAHLRDLERRFGVAVTIGADDSLIGGAYYALERGDLASGGHEPIVLPAALSEPSQLAADDFEEEATFGLDERDAPATAAAGARAGVAQADVAQDEDAPDDSSERRDGESEIDADNRRKRRRRRRRGRGGDREGSGIAANAPQPPDDALEVMAKIGGMQPLGPSPAAPAGAQSDDVEYDEAFVVDMPLEMSLESKAAGLEAAPLEQEAEAAPAKSGQRRRPRRGSRLPEAGPGEALELDVEPAAELALEAGPGSVVAVAGADGEADAASAPHRGRRAPRARAPRRSPAGVEVEALPLESGPTAPDAEPAAPQSNESLASSGEASSDTAPVDGAASGAPAAELGHDPTPGVSGAPDQAARRPGEPETPAGNQHQEPAAPKRSGWWQRAKASLGR